MRRPSYIAAIILAAGISLFGQQILCSNVSVDGPTEVLMPGEIATFTSRIQPLKPEWPVNYFWRISSGKILSGQGTPSIRVESQKYYVTASVSLGGIPMEEHCPAYASWMARWNIKPEAEKLAGITGHKFEPSPSDLQKLGRLWSDDHLTVFLGFNGKPAEEGILTRQSDIIEKLGDKFESTRTTFHSVFGAVNITEFWRVPSGADDPICDGCRSTACPTISVIGPAGLTEPGQPFVFSAGVTPNAPKDISYRWRVSNGEIVAGQGTMGIKVAAKWTTEISITATVEILGIPEGCANSASETAGVTCNCGSILVDESSVAWDRINRKSLNKLADALQSNKGHFGYIIEYLPSNTPKRIIDRKGRLIKDYLTKTRGIDAQNFKIVFEKINMRGRSTQNRTKLFVVPPGAEFPAP